MRFAAPEVLWLLGLVPAWAIAAAWLARRRRVALERFAGGALNAERLRGDVGVHRRAVRVALLVSAWILAIVALARPQWGERVESLERRGIDLVIALDTSKSMAVRDVAPDRFRRARLAAGELVSRLRGDRVALVAFAGKASLLCPLTVDREAVRLFLDAADLESAPIPGTALADALSTAIRAFGSEARFTDGEQAPRGRMIVLYSDGENHEEGLDGAIASLRRAGVVVWAVGVGTPEGGPIPEVDESGDVVGYKKDRAGKVVTSALDDAVLERLAVETGGRYLRATSAGLEIDDLLGVIEGLDAGDLGAVLRVRYEERFAIPAALALIALAVELGLRDARRRRIRAGGEAR